MDTAGRCANLGGVAKLSEEGPPRDHGHCIEHGAGHASHPGLCKEGAEEVRERQQRCSDQPQQQQHEAEAGVREGVARYGRAQQPRQRQAGPVSQRPRAPIGRILRAPKISSANPWQNSGHAALIRPTKKCLLCQGSLKTQKGSAAPHLEPQNAHALS